MSTLRLHRLHLENFQGAPVTDLTLEGRNATIHGHNETGKTTLASAVAWLFSGKDSLGRMGFDIKPREGLGTLQALLTGAPRPDVTVEGEFLIDGGGTITLRRVLREKYTQVTGTEGLTFGGHETSYHIDGLEQLEKHYLARLDKLIPAEFRGYFADPQSFPGTLHESTRRAFLLELCGEVTFEDVVASDPELERLPAILEGRTPEEHRARVASLVAKTEEELKRLPAKLEEARRGLAAEGELPSMATAQARHGAADKLVEAKQAELQAIRRGGQAAELRGEAMGLKLQIQALEAAGGSLEDSRYREALEAHRMKQATLQDSLRPFGEAVTAAEERVTQARKARDKGTQQAANLASSLENLAAAYRRIFSDSFPEAEPCPTCRELPKPETVEARRREYNETRAAALEENTAEGKEAKQALVEAQLALEPLEEDLKAAELALQEAREAQAKAREDFQAEPAPVRSAFAVTVETEVEGGEAIAGYRVRLGAIEAELATLQEGTATAERAKEEEIRLAKVERTQAADLMTRIQANEDREARVAQLVLEVQAAGNRKVSLKGEVAMLDKFTKAQASLIDEAVNSRFRVASFRMFEQLVNGGLKLACQVTDKAGVSYNGGLNQANRRLVELDILRTISEHYNVALPVFADGAESVCEFESYPFQLVRLVVARGVRPYQVTLED